MSGQSLGPAGIRRGALVTAAELKGSGPWPRGRRKPCKLGGHRSAHPRGISLLTKSISQMGKLSPALTLPPPPAFRSGPHHSRGWPPGPGTAGCGGTWRRPSGSSAAGARAPAPAPAPGPVRAPALLWDTKGGGPLISQSDAGRGRAAIREPPPHVALGWLTSGKPGVRNWVPGTGGAGAGTSLAEVATPPRALSHDESLGPQDSKVSTAGHCCPWGLVG